MIIVEDLFAEPGQLICVRQRNQIDGSGILMRAKTGEAAGTRWNMRAQSFVVGDDQLFLNFVIGDGGREIAGRNVTDAPDGHPGPEG